MKICFSIETIETPKQVFPPPFFGTSLYLAQEKEGEIQALIDYLPKIFGNSYILQESQRQFYIHYPYAKNEISLVLNCQDTITFFKFILKNAQARFIGHNVAVSLASICKFDTSIIPLVFKCLDQNRFHCTYLRELLINLKNGDSTSKDEALELGNLIPKHLNKLYIARETLDRSMPSATSNMDINDLQDDLIQNSLEEVALIYQVFRSQENQKNQAIPYLQEDKDSLVNETERIRASFALYLITCKGIKVDTNAILELKNSLLPKLHSIEHQMVADGFANYKNKNRSYEGKSLSLIKKDVKAIAEYLKNKKLDTQTTKGNTKTSSDALSKSQHPTLEAYANFEGNNIITTYLPSLLSVFETEIPQLHPQFTPFSETGRVNGFEPNLLNLPREGGVRECFVARDNHCFIFADYESAEMRTFAQALLDIVGKSKLAERFQANPLFDPHSFLVAEYLNISYEEVLERKSQGDKNIKQMRQMMKAANFGFMGGASARNFGAFARDRYGVMDINSKKANELYNFYMRVFPEVDSYFSWITSQLNSSVDDEMTVILPRSGRIAGKKRYTQVCNCFAQGVAADGALKALYEITKESFDVNAILSRCRPILFIHDEIIVETPIDKADIVAKEIKRVMEKSMEHFTPNVPSIVSIAMADRWYKDAEAKYDSNGKLISWTPNSSKQNP